VRLSPRTILLASLIAAAACAPPESEPEEAGPPPAAAPTETGLVASLTTSVEADTVRFELHLTNMTEDTVQLEFPSSQRFDFEVRGADGASAWRWSAARSFAQVVGAEPVAPGATVTYGATWEPGGRSGGHTVVGWVTSTNRPIELRTEFELPDG
jgi:hypothetical protein